MSVYYIDNQAAIQTKDNKIIIFNKGGDNNLISCETNKRYSKWSIEAIINYEKFDDYVEYIILNEYQGGCTQYEAYKNTCFEHPLELDYKIYKRYEKIFQKRMFSDFELNALNEHNINDFIKNVHNLFLDNKYKLSEYGYDTLGIKPKCPTRDMTEEQAAIDRIKSYKTNLEYSNLKYNEFLKKYHNFSKEELINDVFFCSQHAIYKKQYNHSIDILASIACQKSYFEFDYACFNLILSNDFNLYKLLTSYAVKDLIKYFAPHFETIIIYDSFKERLDNLINNETCEYNKKTMLENKELILTSDYRTLVKETKQLLEEERKMAKTNFINSFNSIVKKCWYKQTNTLIPNLIKEMNKLLSFETFTIEDCLRENVKVDENIFLLFKDLEEITKHHKNQLTKNKKAIVEVANYIVEKFHQHIDEKIINNICNHFNIKKPIVEKKEEQMSLSQITEVAFDNKLDLYDDSVLENFRKGCLF
ncbi:hypothetical protein CP985_14225 [Malaciobacter mytili LMG 24559]|uniref:Uncharacterized protein n=1 Tax=Malaciobacter mytili LMG 24559 TaxID=1032238 RepID=A0AAX2AFS9_9BACT|nr:hypothetical protein [Malaciobacter mytili]AXH16332.1 hypothetical protein AMYT_a0032 [Malaciobacter mytili LMG 24559]RXK12870.1 hypothetical protein CP985_14225 [Malaciobacter mytili LMG 24559]